MTPLHTILRILLWIKSKLLSSEAKLAKGSDKLRGWDLLKMRHPLRQVGGRRQQAAGSVTELFVLLFAAFSISCHTHVHVSFLLSIIDCHPYWCKLPT